MESAEPQAASYMDGADLDSRPSLHSTASRRTGAPWGLPPAVQHHQRLNRDAAAGLNVADLDTRRFLHSTASRWAVAP